MFEGELTRVESAVISPSPECRSRLDDHVTGKVVSACGSILASTARNRGCRRIVGQVFGCRGVEG